MQNDKKARRHHRPSPSAVPQAYGHTTLCACFGNNFLRLFYNLETEIKSNWRSSSCRGQENSSVPKTPRNNPFPEINMEIQGCATQRCCPTPICTRKLDGSSSSRFASRSQPPRAGAHTARGSSPHPEPHQSYSKQGKPTNRAQQVPIMYVCVGACQNQEPCADFLPLGASLTSATRQGPGRGERP